MHNFIFLPPITHNVMSEHYFLSNCEERYQEFSQKVWDTQNKSSGFQVDKIKLPSPLNTAVFIQCHKSCQIAGNFNIKQHFRMRINGLHKDP